MGPEVAAARGRGRRVCPRPSTPSAAPAAPTRCCCRSGRSTSSRATRSSRPPFTFFATAGAIHNAGGTPVFVDIDPATFNIAPRRHRGRDHAAHPRHHRGPPVRPDGGRWRRSCPIAARHGLAADRGRGAGDRRPAQDRRRLAHGGRAGHGGHALLLPEQEPRRLGRRRHDGDAGRRAGRAAAHGSGFTAGARQYYHDEVGYNSRLDTLQAAVLLAKLPHLADWSAARARNAARYTEAFAGHPDDLSAAGRPGQRAHLPPVHHRGCRAAMQLQAHLKAAGIGCAIYYPLAAAPAALLRAPGLPARAACRSPRPRRRRCSRSRSIPS